MSIDLNTVGDCQLVEQCEHVENFPSASDCSSETVTFSRTDSSSSDPFEQPSELHTFPAATKTSNGSDVVKRRRRRSSASADMLRDLLGAELAGQSSCEKTLIPSRPRRSVAAVTRNFYSSANEKSTVKRKPTFSMDTGEVPASLRPIIRKGSHSKSAAEKAASKITKKYSRQRSISNTPNRVSQKHTRFDEICSIRVITPREEYDPENVKMPSSDEEEDATENKRSRRRNRIGNVNLELTPKSEAYLKSISHADIDENSPVIQFQLAATTQLQDPLSSFSANMVWGDDDGEQEIVLPKKKSRRKSILAPVSKDAAKTKPKSRRSISCSEKQNDSVSFNEVNEEAKPALRRSRRSGVFGIQTPSITEALQNYEDTVSIKSETEVETTEKLKTSRRRSQCFLAPIFRPKIVLPKHSSPLSVVEKVEKAPSKASSRRKSNFYEVQPSPKRDPAPSNNRRRSRAFFTKPVVCESETKVEANTSEEAEIEVIEIVTSSNESVKKPIENDLNGKIDLIAAAQTFVPSSSGDFKVRWSIEEEATNVENTIGPENAIDSLTANVDSWRLIAECKKSDENVLTFADRLQPQMLSHVLCSEGVDCEQILDWLQRWRNRVASIQKEPERKTKKKRPRDSDDDFDISDEQNFQNPLILTGGAGVGKSSLIRALAEEKNMHILELGPDECRSGNNIRMKVHNAVISHRIQTGPGSIATFFSPKSAQKPVIPQQTLVVVEHVDIFFEKSDFGGLSALIDVTNEAKVPMVWTCDRDWPHESGETQLQTEPLVVHLHNSPHNIQKYCQTCVKTLMGVSIDDETMRRLSCSVAHDFRALLHLASFFSLKPEVPLELASRENASSGRENSWDEEDLKKKRWAAEKYQPVSVETLQNYIEIDDDTEKRRAKDAMFTEAWKALKCRFSSQAVRIDVVPFLDVIDRSEMRRQARNRRRIHRLNEAASNETYPISHNILTVLNNIRSAH